MQVKFLIGGVLLAVLIIGGLWWWQQNKQESGPNAVPVPTLPPTEAAPATPKAEITPVEPRASEPSLPELPSLDNSDSYVRESLAPLVAESSEAKLWNSWLSLDDLVRRFAVVVENATRGDYPRRQLAFLAPAQAFKVQRREGKIYIDPESYDRYDPLVDALLAIPPAEAAEKLVITSPLVKSALAELGMGSQDPLAAIHSAIVEVLKVPLLEGRVELVQPKVMYQYADTDIEALPPLAKQLLRMGPGNVLRIQAYLRDVDASIGQLQAP